MLLCRLLFAFVLLAMALITPTVAEPIRVAVVGLSHDHVFWLLHRSKGIGDIEIVAIYEDDAALAKQRMADAGLAEELLYADFDTMIADAKPDAACLFGSIADHMPHGVRLMNAGVHVMVEKPLALNAAEAYELAAAAERTGKLLLTNYETTWQASTRVVGRSARNGSLGAVTRMNFRMGHPGPIEIGCREPFLRWLLDPAENGGGAVTDFGCYGANLAVWMMDGERPQAVSATLRTLKPDRYPQVDDDATITLEFAGAVATVQASWCWPHHVKETRVFGQQGEAMTLGGEEVRVRRGDDEPTTDGAPPLAGYESDPFTHLATVIRLEREPNALSSIKNNLIVMEILDAARDSAATGKRILLPSR
ncbi:MAG: Gfo/Idh/MocA family oxidoreductase [Planctomycetota bacterium]